MQTNKNFQNLDILNAYVFHWSKMPFFYFIMERDYWINVYVPMVMIMVDALSTYLDILYYSIPKLFLMGFFICSSFSFKTLKLE